MGLLSSIGNIAKSVVTAVLPTKEKIQNVGAVLNAAFNPFSKDTVVANVSNPTVKKVLETVANHPYVSAAIVAAPITAVRNPSAVVSTVSSVIPKSTGSRILLGGTLGVAAPVVVGAVAKDPAGAFEAVAKTPSSIANVEANLVKLGYNPSISSFKELITDNPVIVGGALAAATIVGGTALAKVVIPAVTAERYTSALNEQTAVLKEQIAGSPSENSAIGALQSTKTDGAKVYTDQDFPLLPETQKISNQPSSKKRRRVVRKDNTINVSNRVNVLVNNSPLANKRYLNRVSLNR